MGSLPLPFVLGPVAGGETAPAALRASFSSRGRRAERLRHLANLLTRRDPFTRKALRSARLVLAATPETAALVPAAWQSKVRLATQVGIDSVPEPLPPTRSDVLRLLFVGRFLYWKGMDLGLEAVARLVHWQVPVALTMIGEGPEEPRGAPVRCRQLGVAQHVSWRRWLPQAELAAHYRAHDALLFPSLHDSGGFVVLEALAQGLPVVCLALGGPGQMVTADCGEAIDTTQLDVETCADALASALERVHRHPARDTLRVGAVARAREFDWQHVVGRAMGAVEGALHPPVSGNPLMAAVGLAYSYSAPLGPIERARNTLLGVTLLLYAILNAGIMQVRFPPSVGVPLGEVTLLLCLASINYGAALGRLAATITLVPLLLWWGWGFLRLGVDLRAHGIWAMRDALQLIESLFLLVGFAVISREWLIDRAFHWIGLILLLGCIYGLTYPVASTVRDFSPVVSSGHGLDVPIFGVYVTSAPILMISAAWLLLFYPKSMTAGVAAAALLGFAVLVFQARIIYLCVPALLLVLIAYRRTFAGHGALAIAGVLVATLAIPLLGLRLSGRIGGEIGIGFIADHFLAIFGHASDLSRAASAAAEGVDLRLTWWLGIYERLTEGPVPALFGLGFGIPLTDKQVAADVLIREPHNS